ncbi:MAG: hypothetical protein ABI369_11140 [Acetobacteraceae bacterium]
MTRTTPETPVEQHLRDTDGSPNQRAALRSGTLPGPPPDPQGDENRTPPPIEESGAGNWARTMDRGHEGVDLSGNRQPPGAPAIQSETIEPREHDMPTHAAKTSVKLGM